MQQSMPLADLLNPDGTVKFNRRLRGSVDPAGFKMTVGRNREPVFVPTAIQSASAEAIVADDVYWDNQFPNPGIGTVWALAFVDGALYVGGTFKIAAAGGINNIAKWDGVNWVNLGGGVDDTVRGIAVSGNDVYVCGDFLHAAGKEAQGVARWNGTSWSALGSGIPRICPGCGGTITCMAISGNDLYVGGYFESAGGVAASGIAKWNGTTWSALGSGIPVSYCCGVRSIAINGSDVYVAGSFSFLAGGVVSYGIARWNGSSWSALGSGVFGQAYAVATKGNDVYVGGLFSMAGGVPARNIAKWDGTAWSALGEGTEGDVVSLAVSGNDVYAGLYIVRLVGQPPPDRILKWNGTSWSPLGKGVRYDIDDRLVYVFAIAANGTEIFAGGDFIIAGDLVANGLAKWNGSDWSIMGNGMDGGAEALLVNGNDLLVGGSFNAVAGIRASGIASWDGAKWSAFGSGLRLIEVKAMAISGNNLYVGGQMFDSIGRVINNVAVWDGTRWSLLGSGFAGCTSLGCLTSVNAIAVIGTDIYVGGAFSSVDTVSARNIARWNGVRWSTLGNGVGADVKALATSGTDLYVGGFFEDAGDVFTTGIAKWNGNTWSSLGKGVKGAVLSLAITGNSLYAGGYFNKAGDSKANNIARWDGSEWTSLEDGIDGGVFALTVDGNTLYAAGQFAKAGPVSAKDIARWNGREWFALGSGVNLNDYPGFGLALAIFKGNVYLGGAFDTAGGRPSKGFARWTGPAEPAPSPTISLVSVNGKKLFVSGKDFDRGAVVLINGAEQKTANDEANPTTMLIARKAGKKVRPGDKLRVRNSDGTMSQEFTFPGQS